MQETRRVDFDILTALPSHELPDHIGQIGLDDFVSGSWVNEAQDQLWLKNYKLNRDYIKWFPQIDQADRKACVLVGASPAFLKQIDLLREMSKEDMFIIIASNTVFRRLVEKGVEVDYVFVVEGRDHVVSDVVGVESPQTTVIASPYAPLELVKGWGGKIFFYALGGGQTYGKEIAADLLKIRRDVDVGGGNVVSTSFLWAYKYLKARDFIFTGMSLCYYDDYYFDKRTTEHVGSPMDQDQWKALDMYGKAVRTTPGMTMYKTWLEVYSGQFKGCVFTNATEDGILGVYPVIVGEEDNAIQMQTNFVPWWNIFPLDVVAKAYMAVYKEG